MAKFRKNRRWKVYRGNVTIIDHASINHRGDAPENTSAKNIDKLPASRTGQILLDF